MYYIFYLGAWPPLQVEEYLMLVSADPGVVQLRRRAVSRQTREGSNPGLGRTIRSVDLSNDYIVSHLFNVSHKSLLSKHIKFQDNILMKLTEVSSCCSSWLVTFCSLL